MDVKPKGLLRRLVDLAVSEIERRSRSPQNSVSLPSQNPERVRSASTHRAETASSRVETASPVTSSEPPQNEAPHVVPPPVSTSAEVTPHKREAQASDDALIALDVTWLSPNEAAVRWALTEQDVANARALGHESADLTLRTVAFHASQSGVSREVSDHPITELRGELLLARLRERRMIVSVGLLRDDAFCSIAHVETR